MKIPKRIREEAILICAIAASYHEPISITRMVSRLYDMSPIAAQRTLGARVAVRAWAAATRSVSDITPTTLSEAYALAAQLLREGFTP